MSVPFDALSMPRFTVGTGQPGFIRGREEPGPSSAQLFIPQATVLDMATFPPNTICLCGDADDSTSRAHAMRIARLLNKDEA